MWRSPVAYLHGVQGVAGSNPVIPTKRKKATMKIVAFFNCKKSLELARWRFRQLKKQYCALARCIFSFAPRDGMDSVNPFHLKVGCAIKKGIPCASTVLFSFGLRDVLGFSKSVKR